MAESEIALLQQYARTRDAVAFRELVEQHQDMVFAACHRVLGNRADAEDAAQDCFLKLALAAERLKAPIGGWLHTVAVHGAIDMLRGENARHARERAVARDATRARTHECPWADVRGEVDAAIVALPERLRTPIVLYFLEGHTQAEVAVELGITRPSVSKRLRRSVEALRRRLKRAGVMTSIAALPAMLSGNAAEAAPASLVANLGKVALAGTSGTMTTTAVATGGALATLKTAAALVVAAGAGAGALAIHQATRAPHPTPMAAAAPVVKKLPLTPAAVLDAKLTLIAQQMRPRKLAELVKRQIGVNVAYHERVATPLVPLLKRGTHKVRDVLKAIDASASLTTEVLVDGDRVVICLWQKPNADMLAKMIELAASDDAVERSTAARWLEQVGGRDALVQLLKMLADPDARVRQFAARGVSKGWADRHRDTGTCAVPCVAPEGTGLIVAKALDTATRPKTQENLLYIAGHLHDPVVLPALKRRLAKLDEKIRTHKGNAGTAPPGVPGDQTHQAYRAIARIGGREAEAFLLATVDQSLARIGDFEAETVAFQLAALNQSPDLQADLSIHGSAVAALGTLGTDKAVAQLGKLFDIELKVRIAKKAKGIGIWHIPYALASSQSPAAARELIRIMNLPIITKEEETSLLPYLAKFDTREARAVCLEEFKAAREPGRRFGLANDMLHIPAVQRILFAELAQDGVVARKGVALLLASTYHPRLVPAFVKVINIYQAPVYTGNLKDAPSMMSTAVNALGRIGGPKAEKALIALAKSGNMDTDRALSALGWSSSPKARETLRTALKSPIRHHSNAAAHALTLRPDPADLDLLLAYARTEPPAKEIGTFRPWTTVAAIGGERVAAELVAGAARSNDAAAHALVFSDDPHCIKAVRDVFAGDDAKLRGTLLAAFDTRVPVPLSAYYAVGAAVGAALAALPEADEERKRTLMELLAWTQDPRATDALGKLIVNAKESLEFPPPPEP